MEIAVYLTVEDDATPAEIATAMQLASEHVCANLRERKTPMHIDEPCDLQLSEGKLQHVTFNRYE